MKSTAKELLVLASLCLAPSPEMFCQNASLVQNNTVAALERNFHEFLSRESRFRPYFSRVLRTWLIFLRVPTVTWASGTVLGRLSFKAANNRC